MCSRISNETYRDTSSNDTQFTCCPNYVYNSVDVLAKLEVPKSSEKAWCRTIGLLQSLNGQFFIFSINSTGGVAKDRKIQVSMVYLESLKYIQMLQSIVMPCPVQIFGSILWRGGKLVMYATLMQVLTAPRALQMKDIMDQLNDIKTSVLKMTK